MGRGHIQWFSRTNKNVWGWTLA